MRKIFRIRLVIGLFGVLLLNAGCLHATTPTTPQSLTAQITQQLVQQYPETAIEQVSFKTSSLGTLISERIDARLLEDNPSIEGTDFQLARPATKHAVAMLTLSYPTSAIALRHAERLGTHRMYFYNTKILTPFRYAVVDNTLVIVFTESGFDDLMEILVKTLG